ncbi:ABC transporter substrate-binding protein [Acuticoccus kandeliae]|uniref:ABC transporter substrate-binding protein n=1 Tax=Acuticoccus kandeliae TaxID=2073160 RepID=UPI000D3EC549|nr:ABC transporter substrate-binding protein [Acuticoccus kandeliae]
MQKFAPHRRRVLQLTAGAAAVGLASPALIGRARAAGSITVADPGGPFREAFSTAFYRPFEEATGNTVINVARDAEPTAQFKAIVETGSYTWDVCTLTISARDILAAQDLLDPIGFSHDDVPDLMPEAINEFWMGTDVYSTIKAFRTDILDKGPSTWAEFWDVEAFPGVRSLRQNPIDTLEQALMADGVAPADLYPLDVDRAFASLDKIKKHIAVWWSSGAQSTQLIQSGEVDMIPGWNARLQAAIDGGAPVALDWTEGLYSIEGWGLPKGGPRADLAREFVRFCSDPERQAAYTSVLSYGPTNLKAYEHIDAERAKILPTSPNNLSKMVIANSDWWAENRAEVSERFNTWLLS